MVGWQTVNKLAKALEELKYSQYLLDNVLSTQESLIYDPRDNIQLDLIGIGALAIRNERVEASSPLIRSVLIKNVVATKTYTFDIIPVTNGLLDVAKLMRYVIVFV